MNKSIHFRAKNVILPFAILFAMLFSQQIFAQTIFSENLGTPGGTTTIVNYSNGTAPATFQNKGILTYSNGGAAVAADLRATSGSSTYMGASGGGNVFFTSTNNTYGFSIESINAATYTSLTLAYGYRKESATVNATFAVEYWDGATWVVVANTAADLFNEAANAAVGWYAAKTLTLPAAAQINGLKIRFVKSGTASIRIDDIVFSGTASTTGATTLADGVGVEPGTMSSLINTQGASALNFDVLVQDDGVTPANDALPTQLTQLVFTQGTGNDVANWSLVIEGAELSDGTNTATGTIGSNSITFAGLTALGLIADDASKTYTLKVWLKTDLTTLKTTIDGLNLVFRLQNSGVVADVAGSQLISGQDVNSFTSNNEIVVVATTLGFAVQPSSTNAGAAMTPAVVLSTNDANGNRDIDFTDDIIITSSGTLVGGFAAQTPTLGVASFNALTHSALGMGLVLTADAAPLTGTSTMFDIAVVTAPTDYFRSKASGLWSAPASWESSADNITWMNATLAPTSAANLINIKSTHDISINADVAMDQTTVENGGILTYTAGVLTINEGVGEDLVIENGGVFVHNTATALLPAFSATTARFAIRTGGMIDAKSTNGPAANYASNAASIAYQTNMQWEDKSIFNWNNTGTPSTSNRTFFPNANSTITPILRISATITSIGSAANPTTVNGVLDVRANFSWIASTSAVRTFRNGIIGTATVSITGTGTIKIDGTSAELGGAAGTLVIDNGASNISVTSTALNVTSDVTVSGTGAVVLGAAAAQTVNGNDFAIGGLTMNNAAGATLASPLKVKGALTLTNGLLNTTATNLLKLGTLSTTPGASATSFVNGPVSKDMDATTPFIFPTGKGATVRSIAVTPANTTLTTYTAEFFDTPAPNLTPITAPLVAVGSAEYFDLQASPSTPAVVELAYSLNPGECTDAGHLTLAHYTGGAWVNEPATASVNSTTTVGTVVTAAAVTSFSPFAIGSTSAASVLPIELKSFTATKKGAQNLIQWETATEENLRVFVVEKSNDATNWTALTSQTPQITKRYAVTDNTPFMPMTYYRLRNIDNDGRQAVSKTVVVSSDKVSFAANVVTASKDGLRLNIYSDVADEATLQLVDMSGRIVMAQSFSIAANSNIFDVPVDLSIGIYMVKIQTNNGESFNRLISIN